MLAFDVAANMNPNDFLLRRQLCVAGEGEG